MSMELDVFFKPDQLPATYMLLNNIRYALGVPCKIDVEWGKSKGRVPVTLDGQQTGFEMYTGKMSKSDLRDAEIPHAATNAGRTFRVNLVWRRPLEGAAAYAFAGAIAKMKPSYILDGQTNVRLKPEDAYAVAKTLLTEAARQAKRAAAAAAAPPPRVNIETEAEHETFLQKNVLPLLGDGWIARGTYLIRVPIGPILFGVDVSLGRPPRVGVQAFVMPLYVPRYDNSFSTMDISVRDGIFETKAPARADEAAIARKLASLVKTSAMKWFAGVATPELIAKRVVESGDDIPYDVLPNSLILAGRYDEARKPLDEVIEYHKPQGRAHPTERVAHKQRVDLRNALAKDPQAARKLLAQLAKDGVTRIGLGKWHAEVTADRATPRSRPAGRSTSR